MTVFAPELINATIDDYPIIQNMARFYVYDMSRYCGFISEDWACPEDGLYECLDFKSYFIEPDRKAFLVRVGNELAGFVLLNQVGTLPELDWNVGEFFILAKYQGKGVGKQVAHELWNRFPGVWEVSVIPENKAGLVFWRHAIMSYTLGNHIEQMKTLKDESQSKQRIIFNFNTKEPNNVIQPNGEQEMHIAFLDHLDESLEKKMTDGYMAYERRHGIDVNYKPFSLVLSVDNTPCGVINAYTAFAEIYVDDIWVDDNYRGKGYGKQLLQALENRYKGLGFNNINLCTSAFQAPEFYKKCGYHLEFTRINKKNPKLSKSFFVKFFEDEIQTQGIIHR